jgi:hypothetical protein
MGAIDQHWDDRCASTQCRTDLQGHPIIWLIDPPAAEHQRPHCGGSV